MKPLTPYINGYLIVIMILSIYLYAPYFEHGTPPTTGLYALPLGPMFFLGMIALPGVWIYDGFFADTPEEK